MRPSDLTMVNFKAASIVPPVLPDVNTQDDGLWSNRILIAWQRRRTRRGRRLSR
jgi:hypothetical protein